MSIKPQESDIGSTYTSGHKGLQFKKIVDVDSSEILPSLSAEISNMKGNGS